ncbi:MAG: hypothetical protein A2W23_05320 [Planctomycetes bacterium RBG_16_43_13]|nr:MAG: hypothetical protein A2W23_05320 [Planctomycetes bacterium RBG_16_43_13]
MNTVVKRLCATVVIFALAITLFNCGGGATTKGDMSKLDAGKIDVLKGMARVVLDNGLTVVVKEDHKQPVVTTMIWYKVGSVNEQEGITGVSHFLEHMMFKGTDKYKKGDIDLVTFRNGGQNNAFTGEDYTAYFFDFASDKWGEALEVEASRMQGCLMDEKEFEAEKQVVIEELHRALDRPWGKLSFEVEKNIFTQHPYHHPVLGWKEDLLNLTRDKMVEYYKKYYVPNNATLVVVGDVEMDKVFQRVKDLFSEIPRGGDIPPVSIVEPPQDAEKRVEVKDERGMNLSRLMVSFRTDKIATDSDYVFDLIGLILSDGKNSRLYRKLVEEKNVANSIDAGNDARKYDGVFTVSVELAPNADLEEVERIIYEELDNLKNSNVTDTEMQKAKNRLMANKIFGMESTRGVASLIGRYETVASIDYISTYLDRINAVTKNDIKNTAEQFFRKENRTVGWINTKNPQPTNGGEKKDSPTKEEKPSYKGDYSPDFSYFSGNVNSNPVNNNSEQSSLPVVDLGEVWDVRLDNGLTVLVVKRADLPVVAVRAFVNAGSVYDPDDKAGLANIVGDMLDEGTNNPITGVSRSSADIAESIEFIGGSLSTSSQGVEMKVLSKDTKLALDLLYDMLKYPSFPQDRVEHIKELTLAEIEGDEDNPDSVARKLFYENVYADHPLRRPEIGHANTVSTITRDDILSHYKRFFRPDNTIIAVVGDVSPVKVVNAIRSRFTNWLAEGAISLPEIAKPKKQTAPKIVCKNMNTQQIKVYIGHLGIERANPDYYALTVMDNILGVGAGFTDRLSKTLRNEEGLAYVVYASITSSAGIYPGVFTSYIGTKPDNKDKAVGGIFREINKFLNEGATDEEVQNAKDYLIRSYVFRFDSVSEIANYIVATKRYGLGSDFAKKYPYYIASITKDDVMRAARKYLDTQNYTMVIVGPVDEKGNVIKKGEEGQH